MIIDSLMYTIGTTIVVMMLIYYNIKLFGKMKYNKPKSIIIILVLMVMKILMNSLMNPIFNMIFISILCLSITILLFSSSTMQAILFTAIYSTITLISEVIASVLMQLILRLSYDIITSEFVFLFLGTIISLCIQFIIIFILLKFVKLKENMPKDNAFWYITIFPLTSLLIIYSINDFSRVSNDWILIIIILGLLISNIGISLVFIRIIETKNLERDYFAMKNKEISDQFYYELMKQKFDATKSFMHDFKKHISVINMMVHTKDFEKLSNYIRDLNNEINTHRSISISENKMIDLVLNTKKDEIDSKHIRVDTNICKVNTAFISDVDFNIIFSNIVDNAIESCIISKEKNITIKLNEVQNNIILLVTNSCDFVQSELTTTKVNKEYHGYGISNIKKIIKKYDGYAKFEYDKNNKIFITSIFFPIPDE